MVNVQVGDYVKIDLNKVKSHDNMPPYIRLVSAAIRNAEGRMPYVAEVEGHGVYVRAWELDFLGDVFIPKNAIIKVKKGKMKKENKMK